MTVAINQGMTLGDMSSIIRPHPTFEEGITEAVRE
jgi:pyruvate/2-oxoglutarate dehydrogenase complex dihydrolipoamide dehydrogenase (E3) component